MADLPQRIFPITGTYFSHPYDWGGNKLIPETLGFEPEEGVPYAEYWLGVHPKALAKVRMPDGSETTLDRLINEYPQDCLGVELAARFETIPYLFKLLESKEMLSIQVHPTKPQAEEGFMREEAAGIKQSDPKRIYKDSNHKPEFAVALGDFWLLHGFKQQEEIFTLLHEKKEFAALRLVFGEGDYQALYTYIMRDMPDEEAQAILKKLADRIVPEYNAGKLEKSLADYWAAKAIKYMHMKDGAYDRGLFSVYLLNLVKLNPYEGIFQNAGILHAYLEGPVVEVMTTSDNVARGGITPKHVDVDELLKLVKFQGVAPKIIEGRWYENEEFYDAPIDEFVVSIIKPSVEQPYKQIAYSGEILLGMEGAAHVTTKDTTYPLGKGQSVFIAAGTTYEITGAKPASIFKASIPAK